MHQTITLPNGARILTEAMPNVRTAGIAFYVAAGSRHEGASENGAAHFIEHMLFKGTLRRDARALAMEMDAIGGQVNAYTNKELTCFHARCLDSHLGRAINLLCEMLFCSRFDEGDVALERGVILEEIGMYEDTPDDLCAERLAAAAFKGCALGRPVLGRASTLEKMTGEWLREYRREHYVPAAVTAALAGSFAPEAVDKLREVLSALPEGPAAETDKTVYRPAVTVKRKAIEQNHLELAFPGLCYRDDRRYRQNLLCSILGGGVSSRLFQELREKRGLCYSVYAYTSEHADAGLFGVSLALNRETEAGALEAARGIVTDLAEHGPTQEELDRVREQIKANLLMSREAVAVHVSHMGVPAALGVRYREPEEILGLYDAVTREQLRQLAGELFRFENASLSAVGRVSRAEEYRALLQGWQEG